MADENSREGTSMARLEMNVGLVAQSDDLANVISENLQRAGFVHEFFDPQVGATLVMGGVLRTGNDKNGKSSVSWLRPDPFDQLQATYFRHMEIGHQGVQGVHFAEPAHRLRAFASADNFPIRRDLAELCAEEIAPSLIILSEEEEPRGFDCSVILHPLRITPPWRGTIGPMPVLEQVNRLDLAKLMA
jgi:hypothetical protein